MKRIVLHIDANSAFLSWSAVKILKETGEDVREIPSVIGGDESKRKGIVVAKSIPSKKYGVLTGEPIFIAKQKCPQLRVIAGDYNLYCEMSDKMADIISEYSPKMQRYSIDECFLEYTGQEHIFGSGINVADLIRNRIKKELGFTVNVGVGENKLLAKMASELEKPDKTHTIFKNDIQNKMWPLDISELFMLGRSGQNSLRKIGVDTIGDLANLEKSLLINIFGNAKGNLMYEYSHGIDNSEVKLNGLIPIKSISNATTTVNNLESYEEIYKILLKLCDEVAYRLRIKSYSSSLISVTIKYDNFEKISKQKSLSVSIFSLYDIFCQAKELVNFLWNKNPVRAIGVCLSKFTQIDTTQQNFLKLEYQTKQEKIDVAADKMRIKYGDKFITRAAILDEKLTRVTPLNGIVVN
ncbi:MAG: DNA polymerase IV [Clostridia bacterium]